MLIVLLVALFGPCFTVQNPYNLSAISLSDAYKPPFWVEGGELPFVLGTDQQGRDILSAIVYGSRVSLVIGFLGVIFAGGIGVALGLIAGYFGGKTDALIMRLADVQLSFPTMLIALLLMSFFEQGVSNILIALAVVGWVRYARTVRGEVLVVKKKEYVEATKVIGLPNRQTLVKHVLPNVLTSIIVLSTIQIGNFILTEATLSFLGLGVPITRPSLGMLCSNGFKVLYSGLWWVSIFPGLYIMLIVFGINLLGDFLRDEFNPRLK
ncbi:MAG: ABC transporter permease [Synergistaceae bacterium]|nr:ABC transporter permease [Synergistaceae bacterium]